jgi:2-methylcitrate dehydratase PrpD
MTRTSRRRALQAMGATAVAVIGNAATASASRSARQNAALRATDVTARLARYIAAARSRELPPATLVAAKHRILDTIAAIVSGARLKPGTLAMSYVRSLGGVAEASVVACGFKTSAVNAALANGMFAHADETDDFEPVTKAHPGCAVVPAALAMAERHDCSGPQFIAAVALGYDLCCRLLLALGPDAVRATHRSAEGVSATFGAVGAAAALARLDEPAIRYALSFAAQQVSGVWSWERDEEHVEKAFDFGGMGARNGVSAATMAEAGMTGVPDVLDGTHNLLQAFSTRPDPEAMVADLGARFFIAETAIKRFSVGYPIQAPLDAFLTLRREHALSVDNVQRIVARLPADGADVVDDRAMPDVNLQYALAVALLDGGLSFEASHSYERMKDPRVLAAKRLIALIPDRALMDPAAPRSGRIEVTLRDGRTVAHFTRYPPGTKENPLSRDAIVAKARELIAPVLGSARADAVVRHVETLETLTSIRTLSNLLAEPA